MTEEEIRKNAKARGAALAYPAAVDSVDGMSIRERFAIEMMPVAAGVVERRQVAAAISKYVTETRATFGPGGGPTLNASRFSVGNLEQHVDEIADQAVILADALLRRLAAG